MKFVCDKTSAQKVCTSNTVTATGVYTGEIRQARIGTVPSGATVLELVFKTTDGLIAWISLWIRSRQGERTFGQDIFDALMVVLGFPCVETVAGDYWDRHGMKFPGDILPDLCNKPVGMLLQRTNIQYVDRESNVREGFRMDLVTPFDVKTRRVAKEILENSAKAELLDIRARGLKDRQELPRESRQPSDAAKTQKAESLEDSEIPF